MERMKDLVGAMYYFSNIWVDFIVVLSGRVYCVNSLNILFEGFAMCADKFFLSTATPRFLLLMFVFE